MHKILLLIVTSIGCLTNSSFAQKYSFEFDYQLDLKPGQVKLGLEGIDIINYYTHPGYSELIYETFYADDATNIQSNGKIGQILDDYDAMVFAWGLEYTEYLDSSYYSYYLNSSDFQDFNKKLSQKLIGDIQHTGNHKKIKGLKTEEIILNFDDSNDTLWIYNDYENLWPQYSFLEGIPIQGTLRLKNQRYSIELLEKSDGNEYSIRAEFIKPATECVVRNIEFFEGPFDTLPNLYVFGKCREFTSEDSLSMIPVEVYRNDKLYATTTTDSQGRFAFEVHLNGLYEFKFGGVYYINKLIEIDMTYLDHIDFYRTLPGGFELNMDINLFKPEKGENWSIMDRPFGKAKYSESEANIKFDFEYTAERRKLLEEILKKRSKKKK